ncbi:MULTISPECIES: substrate-binding domain-containing protein [Halobacterium]|uniref:substrate-binding domain-containing protein n=1 Tax=Halobacterium TaxID=2239 RepID=UPI00073F70FB|nr:substrate-binding domain-containing protein [Halobacterium sp. CBA1132]MCG1004108.1 substrate-binding domain-containing protein [Halobacterium noricense]
MPQTRRQFVAGAAATAAVAGSVATGLGAGGESTASALVAGSLLSVASDVPDASVEAHGSLAARRLVTSGARSPDALALADPALFAGVAESPTLFATNALTLAYDPESAHADAIRDDWPTALRADGVRVGRTDPAVDPLGYRTLLALRLAARRGLLDDADPVVANTRVFPETQLARVLDSGNVDAAFVYRSMAVEYDMPTVDLPPAIDFSDPARADTYASVSLDLGGRVVTGAPIRYGAVTLTERGRSWVQEFTEDADRLRDHGFRVPDAYPVTERESTATPSGD